MNAMQKRLIQEMEGIINQAETEKRGLKVEEIAKIEEIKASVRAMENLPAIPEEATPEARSQATMPEKGKAEFRATITTTGNATLDGTKAQGVWDKVGLFNPVRSQFRIITGTGKAAIPVPGAVSFATTVPAADGGMSYTGKPLTAKRYAAKIPVSEDLLQDATFDLEDALSYDIAKAWGKKELLEVLQGAGTADIAGISGTLDAGHKNVVASPTAATIVGDIMKTVGKLDAAFRARASVMVNATTHGLLLSALDTNKQVYVGPMGQLYVGGLPVYPVDGLTHHAIVGDFSQVAMLVVKDVEVKKLVEVDALAGNVVFLAVVRADAAPMDAGAFAGLTAS